MILNGKQLTPVQFLTIIDLAPEWSLASLNGDLVLYVRYVDEGAISMYLGPSHLWFSELELSVFYFKVKSRILRAKGLRI